MFTIMRTFNIKKHFSVTQRSPNKAVEDAFFLFAFGRCPFCILVGTSPILIRIRRDFAQSIPVFLGITASFLTFSGSPTLVFTRIIPR
jgi:hypothetical protein